MKSLAEYLYQSLKLPVFAAIVAGGIVWLARSFVEFSLIEIGLIFVGIFTVLITVKNHFAQARLVAEMRIYLTGISEFERDVAKRLDGVSVQVDENQSLATVSERLNGLEQKFNSSLNKFSKDPTLNMQPVNENIPLKNLLLEPKISVASNISRKSDELSHQLSEGRLQMYLQPVLTLPERDVTHYEAFARLDLGNGKISKCSDFLNEAERSAAIVEVDHQMLLKIITLLRELQRKQVEPGIFWNISPVSLADENFFNDIMEILETNSVLCPQIVVEISQEHYQGLGHSQLRMLSFMRALGVGLSIDHCDNLEMLQRHMKSNRFSFIKIPISTLVGFDGENHELMGVGIAHQVNMNDARLIATHVEKEFQVMELIDLDIPMGQGHLFSEPRPAKKREDNHAAEMDTFATT